MVGDFDKTIRYIILKKQTLEIIPVPFKSRSNVENVFKVKDTNKLAT